MNLILLTKDIRLMLKDLKFQVFFLILVILFILSAISSAVTYQRLSQDFQKDYTSHHDRINNEGLLRLNRMLREGNLNVVTRPSPAVLFSSYSAYPDKINTGVMFYVPTFSKYSTTQRIAFRLNWYFILGVLSGFIMLIMSFEAISHEKRAGTLRLLSIHGFKRQAILWSKYLCYMLLYLIIIIPPALISMLLFFALTGTWSVVFMLKFLLIILLSIPFASFFILLGIFISMAKNYRNAIVVVVFIWLLFVIIIPQSANIIAKQLIEMKPNIEYDQMRRQAWSDEYQSHGREAHSNMNLQDGIRARAVYNADEKASLVSQMRVDDSKRQTQMILNIASISPFIQFERISEIIFDKGFYHLDNLEQTTKRLISQIRNLMIEQDSRDEESLHLFYSWAERNAFSNELFAHPDLLFTTKIETDDTLTKTLKILLKLLPIIILNLFLIVCSVLKLERLDVR